MLCGRYQEILYFYLLKKQIEILNLNYFKGILYDKEGKVKFDGLFKNNNYQDGEGIFR